MIPFREGIKGRCLEGQGQVLGRGTPARDERAMISEHRHVPFPHQDEIRVGAQGLVEQVGDALTVGVDGDGRESGVDEIGVVERCGVGDGAIKGHGSPVGVSGTDAGLPSGSPAVPSWAS